MTELVPPWRPMDEAPKDGTPIVMLYSDLSGAVVGFWGEFENDPDTNGWFIFTGEVGDYERSDDMGDDPYGWVPYPEKH